MCVGFVFHVLVLKFCIIFIFEYLVFSVILMFNFVFSLFFYVKVNGRVHFLACVLFVFS